VRCQVAVKRIVLLGDPDEFRQRVELKVDGRRCSALAIQPTRRIA
jgi:hypothetical protein